MALSTYSELRKRGITKVESFYNDNISSGKSQFVKEMSETVEKE